MNTKHYFEVNYGKTHKVFGPYPTLAAARKASFFYREVNTLHAAQKHNGTGRTAFATCGYDDGELASFASDPEAYGYKSVVVKPAAPMHASWRKYPADFRAKYFADSYAHCFGAKYDESN
jgi:hypothetical protein